MTTAPSAENETMGRRTRPNHLYTRGYECMEHRMRSEIEEEKVEDVLSLDVACLQ